MHFKSKGNLERLWFCIRRSYSLWLKHDISANMTQITPMAESLKWAMCFTNHWTKLSNESVPKNKSYTSFAYNHVKIYSTKAVGWFNEHFHKAIFSDVSLYLFHHLYHERAASLYGWLMKVYVSPVGQTWWQSKLGATCVVINSHSWGGNAEIWIAFRCLLRSWKGHILCAFLSPQCHSNEQ